MFRRFLYIFGILCFIAAIASGVLLTWGYFYITRDLPQLSGVDDYRPPAVTQLFAKDGTLVAEFFIERRYPAKYDEIPALVRNCFVAAEDAAFYTHKGIDPVSILRAVYKNIVTGGANQGASTITQQVVKNLLLSSERTFERKVKEAILSYRLEKHLTKNEILELYLNQIYFGNTAYGIKAAARVYFHKELIELTLAEAAILAGLPKAPSRYSPVQNKKYSKSRQKYVLQEMVEAGYVTKAEAEAASQEKVKVFPAVLNNIYRG